MALNGYVVLDAFFSLLACLASVITVVLVGVSLMRLRAGPAGDTTWVEDRVYLAIQLIYVILGLTVASWVALYLLLNDMVPLWPGAMCIYGVTRIGEGSAGITGWLPTLVLLAQAAKPLVAFAAGAALVIYRVYRRAGASELLPRVLGALLVVALLGTVASATELTYLGVPKRDVPVESGCCSSAAADRDGIAPAHSQPSWLTPAFFACPLLLAFLLWPRFRHVEQSRDPAEGDAILDARLLTSLALAAVALVIAGRFAADVAAPALLHLPYHHCVYDLVTVVPESGVALALLLWGSFSVGWAGVVHWLGRSASTAPWVAAESRLWQSWAVIGYLGAAAMFLVESWLA